MENGGWLNYPTYWGTSLWREPRWNICMKSLKDYMGSSVIGRTWELWIQMIKWHDNWSPQLHIGRELLMHWRSPLKTHQPIWSIVFGQIWEFRVPILTCILILVQYAKTLWCTICGQLCDRHVTSWRVTKNWHERYFILMHHAEEIVETPKFVWLVKVLVEPCFFPIKWTS